jgi:hypothetical protein
MKNLILLSLLSLFALSCSSTTTIQKPASLKQHKVDYIDANEI